MYFFDKQKPTTLEKVINFEIASKNHLLIGSNCDIESWGSLETKIKVSRESALVPSIKKKKNRQL